MPSWKIAKCVELALNAVGEITEYLPQTLISENGFPTLSQAFVQIHNPEDLDQAQLARNRLAFNEAFLLQLLLKFHHRRNELVQILLNHRSAQLQYLITLLSNVDTS